MKDEKKRNNIKNEELLKQEGVLVLAHTKDKGWKI